MFGREFTNHIEILTQSFGQMNNVYYKKIKKSKDNILVEKLKKVYVSVFGIPEIGFQVRGLYFKDIISSSLMVNEIKTILDAGCGIGAYTFWLAKHFPNSIISGGDIDSNKLLTCETIKNELAMNNISFTHFNIISPSQNKKYDLIITIDVLEHIENYKLAIKCIYVLLKKGGHLYVHVPQPNQKRIFKTSQDWHHEDHIHEGIAITELKGYLEKIGFEVEVLKQTFGLFGKLSWEINHILLKKSLMLAGLTFPFLYIIANMDLWRKNKDGLGVAILARKK